MQETPSNIIKPHLSLRWLRNSWQLCWERLKSATGLGYFYKVECTVKPVMKINIIIRQFVSLITHWYTIVNEWHQRCMKFKAIGGAMTVSQR